MQGLMGLSRAIDAINERIGRTLAWLILGAVIISTVNAQGFQHQFQCLA
jgi:TRAP-type mannitol/chloroaromatic compound transport system permease small subunit